METPEILVKVKPASMPSLRSVVPYVFDIASQFGVSVATSPTLQKGIKPNAPLSSAHRLTSTTLKQHFCKARAARQMELALVAAGGYLMHGACMVAG